MRAPPRSRGLLPVFSSACRRFFCRGARDERGSRAPLAGKQSRRRLRMRTVVRVDQSAGRQAGGAARESTRGGCSNQGTRACGGPCFCFRGRRGAGSSRALRPNEIGIKCQEFNGPGRERGRATLEEGCGRERALAFLLQPAARSPRGHEPKSPRSPQTAAPALQKRSCARIAHETRSKSKPRISSVFS